jgi:hypothetical protein
MTPAKRVYSQMTMSLFYAFPCVGIPVRHQVDLGRPPMLRTTGADLVFPLRRASEPTFVSHRDPTPDPLRRRTSIQSP